jgi:ProP effector
VSSNKHHREARTALNKLAKRFPAAFALSNRKPLKLGIRDDLLARGVAPEVASAGLRLYCWNGRYFKAVKAGAPRIDLDGNPAGVVTADEAEHAARKLVEMDAREKQKAAQGGRRGG